MIIPAVRLLLNWCHFYYRRCVSVCKLLFDGVILIREPLKPHRARTVFRRDFRAGFGAGERSGERPGEGEKLCRDICFI